MACPNDETLLALIEGRLRGGALAEVDSHLDGCTSCRDAVGELASGPRPTGGASDGPAHVGRFVLLSRLGEGAMGVVHAAYDPELDRKVAIKLLHPSSEGARSRARLVREAQAMARLSHPHVVTVYDVGTHRASVYVAMELVDGTNLRSWLATPRPRAAVLDAFRQAALGLAAAHDAGLVHRDFKPENVLVDARGNVKVGDFGLAMAGAEGAEAPTTPDAWSAGLTHTGALLGTPAYMAPELLAGERASAAADQFAFGVSLFEALEGTRPFAAATNVSDLRAAIEAGPPAAKNLDRATEALVRRMLAPAPDERHASLHVVARALTPVPRARPWLAVGAVAIAASAAAFALRPAPPTCVAETPVFDGAGIALAAVPTLEGWARTWSSERMDACEDTHVRHAQSEARMDARMACLDRQRGAFDAAVGALGSPDGARIVADVLDALPSPEACASIDGSHAPPAAIRDDVRALEREIDEVVLQNAAADHADALAHVEQLAERAAPLHHLSLDAEIDLTRGDVLRALARYDEAIESAQDGLLAAERQDDPRSVLRGWLSIVRSLGAAGRYAEATTPIRHAEAALERAGSPRDLSEAFLRVRGVLHTNLGELEGAEHDLSDALALARARTGEDSLVVADLHTNLGNLALVGERFDDALAEHEAALRIDRAGLGGEHPRVGCDHHNVAGILRRLDRRDEARTHYLEALRVSEAALGAGHPDVGLTLNSLGLLAYEAGDREEARIRWQAAMPILEDHGEGALVHQNLALLSLDEGRFEDARAHAAAALEADQQHLGDEGRRVAAERLTLGRALVGLGRLDEAREHLERARDVATRLGAETLVEEAAAALASATPIAVPRVVRPVPPVPAPEPVTEPVPEPVTVPVTEPEPAPPFVGGSTVGAYGGRQAW